MSKGTDTWMDRDSSLVQIGEGPQSGVLGNDTSSVGRRGFLMGLGMSGVVAVTGCDRLPLRKALPYLIAPEEIIPGVPLRYASTCAGCPAACGLMVYNRDGRPIKLEGNPDHPISRGGLCATGHAELRGLYDAGRLRLPSIGGKSATWANVDGAVAKGIAKAKSVGMPVVIVTPEYSGPAASKTVQDFAESIGARWVHYASPGAASDAVSAAYSELQGTPTAASGDLANVELLVTLGSDFLGTQGSMVGSTAVYSERKEFRAGGGHFRHVALESSLSLTGAAADQRIQATAVERAQFAATLLREVCALANTPLAQEILASAQSPAIDPTHRKEAVNLAQDLYARGGLSLVVSGANSTQEQGLVALINRVLGNEGTTVRLSNISAPPASTAMQDVFDEAIAGKLGGVILLGVNPVEELPGGDALAKAFAAMKLSVCITDRPTATSQACGIVAAAHHSLESWGDARPAADVMTVQQPTIRPLHGTRHPLENLLVWQGASNSDYRKHLKGVWTTLLWNAAADPEGAWNRALSQGGASSADMKRLTAAATGEARSDDPPQSPSLAGLVKGWTSVAPAEKKNELEVELIREVGVLGGAASFNPWIRELPDPITRTSWHGAVRLSPKRAKALGVVDGDEVAVRVDEVELHMPARILPGQHPNVIGVPVGYGLVDGDAGGKPRNGYQLARWNRSRIQTTGIVATVRATGATAPLAIIQPHASTEGRPIVHQVASHDEAVPHGHHGAGHMTHDHQYDTHWEMVIDLDKCTGCSACVVSCQAENNLPVVGPDEMARHRDMNWLRIDRYFTGDDDNPEVLFEPMLCAQCDNAPCENVCPVAATVHSSDGLNQQVYNRCVGTRYCANNCPYKVRRFNWLDYGPQDPLERMVLNPDVVVRERGVMEKCTFCVQRIQRDRIEAKKRGEPVPAKVETACQQSCPANAISFGDAKQAASGLAPLKEAKRAFQVLADLGTKPSVTYLARIRDGGKRGGHR
jgi:molybdopterin-containing oxidoreductase family iron-sulfur binding subunit